MKPHPRTFWAHLYAVTDRKLYCPWDWYQTTCYAAFCMFTRI